jgi:predicted DNA-binding mobile mystery protein A
MGGVPTRSRKPMMNASGEPTLGWIRTMREARGLSLRQLGGRLGVQGNSVHVAERREQSGGISLYQLQRIADALDCDLFYAFVPRRAGKRAERQTAAEPHAVAANPDAPL